MGFSKTYIFLLEMSKTCMEHILMEINFLIQNINFFRINNFY